MALISTAEVRNQVKVKLSLQTPYKLTECQKRENICSFNNLSREGLKNGVKEKRILLYTTSKNEKIYMQYPGIESVRNATRSYSLDARPVLQKADGSYAVDMDFKKIWDVIERVGHDHKADIDILAAVFLRIAYMIDYHRNTEEVLCETIDIETNTSVESSKITFVWNSLDISRDVLDTLNDRFVLPEGISLESFLYYNDLLSQNEDCKYSYLRGDSWDVKTGRINNCLSHLTVISHIRGNIGISKLIDSFQRTGVAPLPQARLWEACGDLVRIVDVKSDIKSYLTDREIAWRENAYITIKGVRYHTVIKTNSPKIAILSSCSEQQRQALITAGWDVYEIDSLEDDDKYRELISKFENT